MLAPELVDGQLRVQSKVDLQSGLDQVFDPQDLIYHVKDSDTSRVTLPDDPTFAFLGDPGDTVWVASDTHQQESIFPGWSTESSTLSNMFDPAELQFHLVGAEGPGSVEVYQLGDFGDVSRVWSSADDAYRTWTTRLRSHAHANWVFPQQGEYTLTFEVTGTTVDGAQVRSGPISFDWVVGPMAPDVTLAASPEDGAEGDEIALTADVAARALPESQQRATGSVTFQDGDRIVGESAVAEDGSATLMVDDLAAGTHELTAAYTPDSAASPFHGAATSPPATVEISEDQGSGGPGGPGGPGDPGDPGGPDPDNPGPGDTDPCLVEVILDVGHVDVAARIVDGELVSQIKDDTVAGQDPVWPERRC